LGRGEARRWLHDGRREAAAMVVVAGLWAGGGALVVAAGGVGARVMSRVPFIVKEGRWSGRGVGGDR